MACQQPDVVKKTDVETHRFHISPYMSVGVYSPHALEFTNCTRMVGEPLQTWEKDGEIYITQTDTKLSGLKCSPISALILLTSGANFSN